MKLLIEWWKISVQDFMALLAYDEPDKSPMFHLLSSEHRQQVADSLNRAILGTRFLREYLLGFTSPRWNILCPFKPCTYFIAAQSKLPSYSAMERLIQQTTVVRQLLSQEHGKVCIYLLDVGHFLPTLNNQCIIFLVSKMIDMGNWVTSPSLTFFCPCYCWYEITTYWWCCWFLLVPIQMRMVERGAQGGRTPLI